MPEQTNVIYARRSSDTEDKQSLSIDQQLAALRDLAAMRGITIAEELTESASAKDPGRPVFSGLMKRIRKGEIHTVLVWRLDRLARNMVDGGEVIYHLSEGDLKEIVTPETTYTPTGDSKFMMAMLFGAASKYSDDLSSAVRRGNEDVLRRGKVPGPVPLGYEKTHEHELTRGSGTAIAEALRFDTVKRLWKTVLGGETNVSKVWRMAKDEWGLTTRPSKGMLSVPIALTNVYAILRNPFYAGMIRRGGTLYKGEHPPMVTWEEFQRVQELLRGKKRKERVQHAHDFLYHALLHCGACGRAFTAERHEKNGHVYIYYRCDRRKPGTYVCHAPEVREEKVTEQLVAFFETVSIDPTIREWAYEAIAWWGREDEPSPEKVARRAKAALASAEQQLVKLTDLVLRDLITEAEYKVRRMNQLAKVAHFREALAAPVEKLEAWRLLRDEKRKNGLGLAQDFQAGDAVAKRSIIVRTCSNIIMRNGKPHPELKAPFVFRAVTHLIPADQPLP